MTPSTNMKKYDSGLDVFREVPESVVPFDLCVADLAGLWTTELFRFTALGRGNSGSSGPSGGSKNGLEVKEW